MKKFALVAVTLAIGLGLSAAGASAETYGERQLRKLMRSHVFFGQHISREVREATGDPNILVLDRRHQIGEVYSCSYIYMQGRRALLCE